MFKRFTGFVAATCLACTGAVAQAPLSYTYVGAGYAVGEVVDEDFSGYQVYGSAAVNPNVFVLGAFTSLESDDEFFNGFQTDEISADQFSFGIGFHSPISPVADFVASIAYADVDVEFGSFSEDGNGYIVTAGVRSRPSDTVELSASVNYADIEDDGETGFGLFGRVYAAETLSFGIGYGSADDVDTFSFDVRVDL